MKKNLFRTALVLSILTLLAAPVVFADEVFSAADVAPVSPLVEKVVSGVFTLNATVEKPLKVEAVNEGVLAEDGESFNARISTGGSGDASTRSISFKTTGPATVLVYTLSSNKTEARTVVVTDASGSSMGEVVAPASAGSQAKVGTVTLAKAGSYVVASKSGGVYIFKIVVKYADK